MQPQGRIPCDLVLQNVTYLDVLTCEWILGDISLIDGFIVGVEPGLRAKRVYDAGGNG